MNEREKEKMYAQAASSKPFEYPCRLAGEHAPYSISGGYPDGSGGGVLFWCYSLEAAMSGLKWCAENGYLNVKIRPEGDVVDLLPEPPPPVFVAPKRE